MKMFQAPMQVMNSEFDRVQGDHMNQSIGGAWKMLSS